MHIFNICAYKIIHTNPHTPIHIHFLAICVDQPPHVQPSVPTRDVPGCCFITPLYKYTLQTENIILKRMNYVVKVRKHKNSMLQYFHPKELKVKKEKEEKEKAQVYTKIRNTLL